MPDASVDGDHLARQKLDGSIIKIDEETSFHRQKTLIGVGVTMPMVSLSHRAYANFVIIDLSDWMVIVAPRCCRFAREIDGLKREILQEFHVVLRF
jgi:hypothetical protein